jgi:nitrogen fixation-related uncharacterized protein
MNRNRMFLLIGIAVVVVAVGIFLILRVMGGDEFEDSEAVLSAVNSGGWSCGERANPLSGEAPRPIETFDCDLQVDESSDVNSDFYLFETTDDAVASFKGIDLSELCGNGTYLRAENVVVNIDFDDEGEEAATEQAAVDHVMGAIGAENLCE